MRVVESLHLIVVISPIGLHSLSFPQHDVYLTFLYHSSQVRCFSLYSLLTFLSCFINENLRAMRIIKHRPVYTNQKKNHYSTLLHHSNKNTLANRLLFHIQLLEVVSTGLTSLHWKYNKFLHYRVTKGSLGWNRAYVGISYNAISYAVIIVYSIFGMSY